MGEIFHHFRESSFLRRFANWFVCRSEEVRLCLNNEMPPKSQWLNTTCICFMSTFVHFCWEPIDQTSSSSPNPSAGKRRGAHGICSQQWGPSPSSPINPLVTLAHNSLSELQCLPFSIHIMTLRSSRSMPACFMNLSMNVPYKGHVPRPREDTETSLHGMWGKAVGGTSRAQCFAWMAGFGRLFANLAEWGQRFMATPGPLEMLGAFLLVFTPNKKQFPLFKRQIFFSVLED